MFQNIEHKNTSFFIARQNQPVGRHKNRGLRSF